MIALIFLGLLCYGLVKGMSALFNWVVKPLAVPSAPSCQNKVVTIETSVLDDMKEEDETISSDENISNKEFRPTNFDEYIGQKNVKEGIKDFIQSAKDRQETFPHIIISGPPGTGKTLLVQIIAKQLRVNFVETIASNIQEPQDLYDKVKKTDGGILFVDEIHGLGRDFAETVYRLMEEYKIQGKNVQKFTLAGATTELGEILENRKPFYERFKLPVELEKYNAEELAKITKQYKIKQFPNDYLENAEQKYKIIGKNSRGTPRKAIKYLDAIIRLNGDIDKAFRFFKIIKNGFTQKDLKILDYLAETEKPIGLKGLIAYMGTSKANYEYNVEPYLIQTKTIQRTSRGRVITDTGKKILEELKKEQKEK